MKEDFLKGPFSAALGIKEREAPVSIKYLTFVSGSRRVKVVAAGRDAALSVRNPTDSFCWSVEAAAGWPGSLVRRFLKTRREGGS